jgi:MFS family permease
MSLGWFITVYCYYIMNFYVKYALGNLWENAVYAGLAFFSGCVFSGFVTNKLGLKKSFILYFLGAAASGYCMVIFDKYVLLNQILLFTTTLGISSAYNNCYLSNHMIFPHEIKGTCAGITSTCGRFAGIFAPMTVELPYPWPLICFSSACLIGFVCTGFGLKPHEHAYDGIEVDTKEE